MDEIALLIIETEDDGAEEFAAALRQGVAADYAVEGLRDFDFEPVGTAALFVDAGFALGDDAFEALLSGSFEEGEALGVDVVGIAEEAFGVLWNESGEFLFAFF